MPLDPDQIATIVTSRAIFAGREDDFERWAEELNRLARAAPGYRAAIRLGQTAGFQPLLFRFDDSTAADSWQADAAFGAHVAIADRFSTALRQTGAGDGVTFELPSDASASKWKRFVTTWLTVFPVLLVISLVIRTVAGRTATTPAPALVVVAHRDAAMDRPTTPAAIHPLLVAAGQLRPAADVSARKHSKPAVRHSGPLDTTVTFNMQTSAGPPQHVPTPAARPASPLIT